VIARLWISLALEATAFGALLFGAAGTLRWPAAWVFLVVFFVAAALISQMLVVHDPELLHERLKPFVQRGQARWDQVLISLIAVLFVAWLILMGLDAQRFRWSIVPVWLQVAGGVGVALGMAIAYSALRENAYAIPVVRMQAERGQRVVSSGPYAIVRHPMYSGVLLLFPSTGLLLGSWWGVGASALLAIGLAIRTALEDRELQRGLEGYAAYAARVRARLIPLVW
jgi:protein-S-isoprenylcysteine O-methyltransferase Ste14